MQFKDCFDFSEPLSLYIHIPFCKSKCSYCAFYSKPCAKSFEISDYTGRILSEIRGLTNEMGGRPFYTAYIGGGNPGVLSVEQLGGIAEEVCKNGRPVEFSVEMNPESISYGHFRLFESRFTRLSMGVQSLNERALKFLGRNSSLKETLKGLELSQELRNKTGCALNYDIISCLPEWHGTDNDIVKIVRDYAPEHISLYALTLEEGTPLFLQKPDLPDDDRQAVMLSEYRELLDEFGYEHYEVSNYAKRTGAPAQNILAEQNKSEKNTNRCLHNSVYWSYKQYAGIGASAASTGFKGSKAYRIEASSDLRNWKYSVNELGYTEKLEEFVLMGLRQKAGLSLERLKKEFGKRLCPEKLMPAGYAIKGDYLVPEEEGFLTADNAAIVVLDNIEDCANCTD